MKKIYFTLSAVLICLSSFGQGRTLKFEVTLTAPANGASIPKGMTFEQKFVIKNLGPSAIKATDTIAYVDPATASGSYFYRLGYTKAVGDTIQINRSGYSFPASSPSGTTNYCVLAVALNQKDTLYFDTTGSTYQDCNTINITPPTGISELFQENTASQQLALSPNPASATVTLDFTSQSNSPLAVRVYDLTGRVVLSREYKAVNGQKGFGLDIDVLNKGNYFVELRQDDYKAVGKLLKE